MSAIEIRSSSLTGYANCVRHNIAGRYQRELIKAHPDAAKADAARTGGYKPYAGTAFHACAQHNWSTPAEVEQALSDAVLETRDGGEVIDASAAEDFYDEKITTREHLHKITAAMVNAFRKSPASSPWTRNRDGVIYEQHYKAEISDGIILSGHIDAIADSKPLDLKTTGMLSDVQLHAEQLTAYALLLEKNEVAKPKEAEVIKVYRPYTPNFRTEPKVTRAVIEIKPHKARVKRLARQAAATIDKYDRWAGDFTKLPANPNCRACMYCSLRNTSACPETRFTGDDSNAA